MGLQTLNESLDEARPVLTLLSGLLEKYELISSIVESSKDITLIVVKEKLLKEFGRLEKKGKSTACTEGDPWKQVQKLEERKSCKGTSTKGVKLE